MIAADTNACSADALIVFKALRAASDAGEPLTAVCTFDVAMQRLPHTASP